MIDVKKINDTIENLEKETDQLKEVTSWTETMEELHTSFEKLVQKQEKIIDKLALLDEKVKEKPTGESLDNGWNETTRKEIQQLKQKQQELSKMITSQINHIKIGNEQLYQRTKDSLDEQQLVQLEQIQEHFDRFSHELNEVKKTFHENMSMYEYNLKIRSDRLENKISLPLIGTSVVIILILLDIIVRLFQ